MRAQPDESASSNKTICSTSGVDAGVDAMLVVVVVVRETGDEDAQLRQQLCCKSRKTIVN